MADFLLKYSRRGAAANIRKNAPDDPRLKRKFHCDCGEPILEQQTFCKKCSDQVKIRNLLVMQRKVRTADRATSDRLRAG